MDRNSIIGVFFIVVIIIGYYYLTKPSQQQIDAEKRQQDSIQFVRQLDMERNQKNVIVADSLKHKVISNSRTDSIHKKALVEQFGVFAASVKDTNEFTSLENNLLKIKFCSKGGRPYSVELKKYTRYDSSPLILFDGDSTILGLSFFSQNKLIETNNLTFKPTTDRKQIIITNKADSVSYRIYAGEKSYIEYVYTMVPNDYMIKFRVNMMNMNDIISSNSNSIDLNWAVTIPRQEKDSTNENQYSNIQYKFSEDDDESMNATTNKPEEVKNLNNKLKWVAFKQQFFSSVIIAGENFQNGTLKSFKFTNREINLKRYAATLALNYDNKASLSIPLQFYFGPNHFTTLKKYNIGLERIIFLGRYIIRWVNEYIIIPIFGFLSGFIVNFGIIILLLTIIIKVGLFPFTFKSYQSQAKMRVLKPEIDEINKKFSKDKAVEKQQAVMALYKRAGVNPLGGCLPMLFQFPFLFAMFRFFPTSIELRHQHFLWANDLSSYDSIISWTGNIPMITQYYGNHISLFTILMTITTMISMKMTQQTSAMDNQMAGMKTMMYIMPVMFMVFLNKYSSGLTYYYFLANLITIGQNEIFKLMTDEEKLLKQIHANKAKPVKKSSFQERLENMAKQRGNIAKR